ncbi:methylated-DNA--[protein]-cysteine S-methyltransferase [Gorillibacterium massiliense]|uniref:methylated-DNA--[protein]-cysteine S-methyltransferase n=1 Tax=Gorillibacterium massiliense TaxID=1280390 RepID=UPI0004B5551C|nr:methylated-DNA--[protein]-cysteine S-methyltransferase [Gorillibacterium massiliense]
MKNSHATCLYWSMVEDKALPMYIAATEKGLAYVGSPHKSFAELALWAEKRMPGAVLFRDDERLLSYVRELSEYLQGTRHMFTIPQDAVGTAFQKAVWEVVRAVPFGNICSYSDIAIAIGKPASVRAVGAAVGANPLLMVIPCHRIMGKNGHPTGYRGGLDVKMRLLQMEQVFAQGKSLETA